MRAVATLREEDAIKAKNSKQKIFQLKEELNGGNIGINPKLEKLKVLRESYDIAKFRAQELLQTNDQNLYVKVHGQRASKIYSALSTLIFLSISASKVEELEHYISNSASQVPSSIFDFEEWSSIVKVAKDCRESDHSVLVERSKIMRKNMLIFYQLAVNPLRTTQMELKLLRSEVANEIAGAQVELAGSINLISQIVSELQTAGHKSESVEKLNKLLRDYSTRSLRSTADKAKDEEMSALKDAVSRLTQQLDSHRSHHEAEMHKTVSALNDASARASSAHQQVGTLTSLLTERDKQVEELVERLREHSNQVSDQAMLIGELQASLAAVQEAAADSVSASQQAQQAKEFQELFEQYNTAATDLETRDAEIVTLQGCVRTLGEQLETANSVTAATEEKCQQLQQETAAKLAEADARITELQLQKEGTALQADGWKAEAESARIEVEQLRAALAELQCAARSAGADPAKESAGLSVVNPAPEEDHAPSEATASDVSAPNGLDSAADEATTSVTDDAVAEAGSPEPDRDAAAQEPSGESQSAGSALKVAAPVESEEQLVLSLISAEAIHATAVAMEQAAARLVASLSSSEAISSHVGALQATLIESLMTHNEALDHAVLKTASLSPREIEAVSSMLKPSTVTDGTQKNEEELVVSLISAEAIHAASAAVSQAAARLLQGLSVTDSAGSDETLMALQETLVDTLAAHSDVLRDPATAAASAKLNPPAAGAAATEPVAAVEATPDEETDETPQRVHFRPEDSVRMFDSAVPPSGAPAAHTLLEDWPESPSVSSHPGFIDADDELYEDTLSVIYAEAMHVASVAVMEAAAKVIASLTSAASGPPSQDAAVIAVTPQVLELQNALADSLEAQNEVLLDPQFTAVSSVVTATVESDLIETPAKLRSPRTEPGETAKVSGEDAMLLSVISAEAVRAASQAVAEAAQRLHVTLQAADGREDPKAEEVAQLQSALAEAVGAQAEALTKTEMVPAKVLPDVAIDAVDAATATPAVEPAADNCPITTGESAAADNGVLVVSAEVAATAVKPSDDAASATATAEMPLVVATEAAPVDAETVPDATTKDSPVSGEAPANAASTEGTTAETTDPTVTTNGAAPVDVSSSAVANEAAPASVEELAVAATEPVPGDADGPTVASAAAASVDGTVPGIATTEAAPASVEELAVATTGAAPAGAEDTAVATPKAAAASAEEPVVANPEAAAAGTEEPIVANPEAALAGTEEPVVATPEAAAASVEEPVVATPEAAAASVEEPVVATPEPATASVEDPVVATPEAAAASAEEPAEATFEPAPASAEEAAVIATETAATGAVAELLQTQSEGSAGAVSGGAAEAAEGVAAATRNAPIADQSVADNATSDPVPSAAPAGDVAAPPTLPITRDEDVVIVQNQLRGFMARAKVRRIRAEKQAEKQGVLSATKGTVQGAFCCTS
jgi:hypothetical protein